MKVEDEQHFPADTAASPTSAAPLQAEARDPRRGRGTTRASVVAVLILHNRSNKELSVSVVVCSIKLRKSCWCVG